MHNASRFDFFPPSCLNCKSPLRRDASITTDAHRSRRLYLIDRRDRESIESFYSGTYRPKTLELGKDIVVYRNGQSVTWYRTQAILRSLDLHNDDRTLCWD
jgi:hypothetical protein